MVSTDLKRTMAQPGFQLIDPDRSLLLAPLKNRIFEPNRQVTIGGSIVCHATESYCSSLPALNVPCPCHAPKPKRQRCRKCNMRCHMRSPRYHSISPDQCLHILGNPAFLSTMTI